MRSPYGGMTPREDGLGFTPSGPFGGPGTSPIDRTPRPNYYLGGQTPLTPHYTLGDITSQSPNLASIHSRYNQGSSTPFYYRGLGSSGSPSYS